MMRCRQAERWINRWVDARLDPDRTAALEKHLAACPACRRTAQDVRGLVALLRREKDVEPAPGFLARLQPRLREERALVPLLVWERWSLRAVPVFLAIVLVFIGLVAFGPGEKNGLTQSEALLLENRNPLTETQQIFDAAKSEDRNMMLIFASLEAPAARRLP
jgi:anti-sigma factor RsiW